MGKIILVNFLIQASIFILSTRESNAESTRWACWNSRVEKLETLRRFAAFFLSILFSTLSAQDPPGIRWKQIETNHYLLIFPQEISEDAKRAANILEGMYVHTGQEMGGRHRKIPIVMRNRSAIPNAYVTQRPWHSEWNHIPLVLKEMGIVRK